MTAGALTFDAATQTFAYDSTTGVGAGALAFSYTLSDGSVGNVTIDVVNANSNTFSLATSYPTAGSYQASYIDLGGGNDNGTGSTAPDTLLGGTGSDTLVGGDGSDILRGGAGNDTLDGQGTAGDFDLIDLSDATAALNVSLGAGGAGSVAAAGLGTDSYSNMEGFIGTINSDTLNGNAANNELRGGNGNDTLNGLGGNDVLKGEAGNDTINGGAGTDTILGGLGVDAMSGGADADTFAFISTTESGVGAGNRDIISDFVTGADKIDFSAIDAKTQAGFAGDQAFTFIANPSPGADPGVQANSITWFQNGADTIVQLDVNGDTTADMQIQLAGLHNMTASDFIV